MEVGQGKSNSPGTSLWLTCSPGLEGGAPAVSGWEGVHDGHSQTLGSMTLHASRSSPGQNSEHMFPAQATECHPNPAPGEAVIFSGQ